MTLAPRSTWFARDQLEFFEARRSKGAGRLQTLDTDLTMMDVIYTREEMDFLVEAVSAKSRPLGLSIHSMKDYLVGSCVGFGSTHGLNTGARAV